MGDTHPQTLTAKGYDGMYKITISVKVTVTPTPERCNIYLAAKLQLAAQRLENELAFMNRMWRKYVNEQVRVACREYVEKHKESYPKDAEFVVVLDREMGVRNPRVKV